jgi:hypothetical protein
MNLPSYFLADLPPEAPLTHSIVREACVTLRRNRERYLVHRSTDALIETLGDLAASWLRPDYPFRQLALEKGPAATGFSGPILAKGLDHFFSQITPATLRTLVLQEMGHEQGLDRFALPTQSRGGQTLALARGPALLVHITAGMIPDPTLISMIFGLLIRSAQFVKCASGTSLLPRLFAHSLHEADAKLAACLEIAEWPGGQLELENAAFAETDCLTATGRDETLQAIRARLPSRVRFLGYGSRLSFGYVAHEMLTSIGLRAVLRRAADDIVAWDQLGCLSPHVLFVEVGGSVSPQLFAEHLAWELAQREATEPRGPLSSEQAALIKLKRDFYRIRADYSGETQIWFSQDSTAWTVVFESDPLFQISCLYRFVYVKPAQSLAEILHAAEAVRGQVSTVGMAAPPGKAESLTLALARWGVPRICPLGQMQRPPLTWRHDGRPTLGDLIEWTDYEQSA